MLVPALTALANAAAMVFSYIARLVAFFTGKTISASASAAKAMGGVGKAAGGTAKKVKDANGELAAFDELNVLNKKSDEDNGGSSGGGGSAGDIVPDYDFTAKSPFLDSILDAVEAGDWYKVGQLIGEKLRDSLNAIPWPDIQDKAVQWATNLATMLNGIVETPGLWEAIGHTLAQGLNTALLFYDTFMQTFHWASLGAGLAAGLTQAIAEIQWDTLGRALTDGMRAAIVTLYKLYDDLYRLDGFGQRHCRLPECRHQQHPLAGGRRRHEQAGHRPAEYADCRRAGHGLDDLWAECGRDDRLA